MIKLTIIIPVYNEIKTIEKLINKILKLKIKKQLIVVDDGSIDSTYDISVASEAIVVRHKKNKGYEQALESGFQEALNKTIVRIIYQEL